MGPPLPSGFPEEVGMFRRTLDAPLLGMALHLSAFEFYDGFFAHWLGPWSLATCHAWVFVAAWLSELAWARSTESAAVLQVR